jgi:hypothetical protein
MRTTFSGLLVPGGFRRWPLWQPPSIQVGWISYQLIEVEHVACNHDGQIFAEGCDRFNDCGLFVVVLALILIVSTLTRLDAIL